MLKSMDEDEFDREGLDAIAMSLQEAEDGLRRLTLDSVTHSKILAAAVAMADSLGRGGRIFSCGNGGSMCDAMHFAEELSGRFRQDRPALAAVAISDVSHMSCVSNDFGYDQVFSRYLQAHLRPGDVLLAISTSGSSRSVLNACEVARKTSAKVVGLHGRPGSALALASDIDISTPAGRFADRVQELHIKVIHMMIELIELKLSANAYRSIEDRA